MKVGDKIEVVIGEIGYQSGFVSTTLQDTMVDLKPELVGVIGTVYSIPPAGVYIWFDGQDNVHPDVFYPKQIIPYVPPKDLLGIRRKARRNGGMVAPGMRRAVNPKKKEKVRIIDLGAIPAGLTLNEYLSFLNLD